MNIISAVKYALLLGVIFLFYINNRMDQSENPRVLVFSKTMGWKHTSIPFGIKAIQKLGAENGFAVDTTTDAKSFTEDNLKKYQAIIFNNTTGNVLNGIQQAAFERYIQAGGGYAGIHAAADTEYDWSWYNKLMGAHFASHPHNPNVRKAIVVREDQTHPAGSVIPEKWERTDEWYNYRSFYSGIKVIASLDENSYEGGTNGARHPISWYHEFDGGRAFYTGNGHTDESYNESEFLSHLLGGIKYAIGEGTPLDYNKAYAKVTPDQNRFIKTVLVNGLNTPMELAVAPDGRIFYTELYGNISVYNARTRKSALIHNLPITNVGGTGLIGITIDPDFSTNGHIYLFYTPAGQLDEPIDFHLSRFKLSVDNVLDLASEKILLKVPVEKNSGSHHGGSLAWDKHGNLYLSTGDSSSPFPAGGYSPMDERPGTEFYSLDAQRSAGNTNDLKGKILRIHPEPDGTYTIPEGNLFPKGTPKTKPEIYVMGVRNPYRIAVNPTSSVLYWGDIGPDAGVDGVKGPRGYDEFNQAKKPGNFGWPYFIGNNYPYPKWDFAAGTGGAKFDPKAPVNNSPNNTGLVELPPATAPILWYPYAASPEFPELGVGGRCAIGGAFYTFDKNSKSAVKFPDFYDGALFVADWMRNWVFALRFDNQENYVRSDAFMTSTGDFKRPIDMEFGKDGVLYMLEYGSVYGAVNKDARLVKIEYNTGNRKPFARARITDSVYMANLDRSVFLTSERRDFPVIKDVAGSAPLKVRFTSQGSRDLDDEDQVSFQWLFDGKTVGSTSRDPVYTYKIPGLYKAILKVTDKAGLTASDTITVRVGNSVPSVAISSTDNRSFFWNDKPFQYTVKVFDREDIKIDPSRIKLSYLYSAQPDISGQKVSEPQHPGQALIDASDCKSCHLKDKAAVGPDFVAIANRYKTESGTEQLLAKKIIGGGAGSWGKVYVMSAHPQVSETEAREMVKYIFSLTDKKKPKELPVSLPISGSVKLSERENEPRGQYTFTASYIDKGGKVIGPLKGTDQIVLRSASVKTIFADSLSGFPRFGDYIASGGHKAFLLFKNIDLTGIKKLIYRYGSSSNGEIEVRIDSQAGPIISTTAFTSTGSSDKLIDLPGLISKPITGRHHVYIIAIKRIKPNDSILRLDNIRFEE